MKIALLALSMFIGFKSAAMERRKPQFSNEPSYLVMPLPYSLPGIGQGVLATGVAGNVGGSYTDVFLLQVFGDAKGTVLGLDEIYLLPRLLMLRLQGQNITKATINHYESRGMDSRADDFKILEINDARSLSGDLTLTLFDRRWEIFTGYRRQALVVRRIRDDEGEIISELSPDNQQESLSYRLGTVLDLTDDYGDPRRGVRFGLVDRFSPQRGSEGPKFHVIDFYANAYFPFGERHTLAIRAFGSDAVVNRLGETDPETIRQLIGVNCASDDTECKNVESELVERQLAANKYGSATSLGGDNLRGFAGDRFTGGHSRALSMEVRWNVVEGFRPFNLWIWKDIASAIQVAGFYEIGSVAEKETEIFDKTRNSYGSGVRLVSASGFVYRADMARSDEGTEFTILFDYPW